MQIFIQAFPPNYWHPKHFLCLTLISSYLETVPPPPSFPPRFEEEIYTGRFRLKSKLKEENLVGSVPSDDDGKIYDEIYEEEVYKTRSVDTDDG